MKTSFPVLVALISLSLAACGKGNSDKPNPASSDEQEITSSSLPALTGIYASPNAKLRIHEDGRFTLETSRENVRWYPGGANHEQHYATCGILRKGTVQILQRADKKFLTFNVSESKVVKAEKDDRSRDEAPMGICTKATELFAQGKPLSLMISAQGEKQFVLSNSSFQGSTSVIYFDNSGQSGTQADSHLDSEFALLFTPVTTTTDVTDLLASALTATYASLNYGNTNAFTLEINPEFRSLRYVDTSCGIDIAGTYSIVSEGGRVVMRFWRNPSAPSNNPGSGNSSDDHSLCGLQRTYLSLDGPQELLDISNPSAIRGLGSMSPVLFRKSY